MKLFNFYKIILILHCLVVAPSLLKAGEQTDKEWYKQLKVQGITANDQSYCYTDQRGEVQGSNFDMRVRLASVSKLLTSLWSLEKLGADYKYDTKLYIKGNSLHIKGSYDPFLGDEKMFFLISQLNELGYEKFDTITFDKNVIINPDAQHGGDEYPTINAANMIKIIKNYFNTNSWTEELKEKYSTYYRLAKQGQYRKIVYFTTENIKRIDVNPYENDDDARVLTLSSPVLYKYLKEMNVKSNNYVAETIFRQLGGALKFSNFLNDRFGLKSDRINFFTGSGLPLIEDSIRKDNYATCRVMLNLILELKITIEHQNKEIEDVVAVPGSDAGTFRNRIFPSEYKNSFVAKTGTLMHTSTLAGAMNTQEGFSFFGIFNQSEDIVGSKTVQNLMVKSIMTEMGGPKAFNYVVEGFHTYDDDVLKWLLENESNFSSVENNLF